MSTVPHDTEINQDAVYAAARLSTRCRCGWLT